MAAVTLPPKSGTEASMTAPTETPSPKQEKTIKIKSDRIISTKQGLGGRFKDAFLSVDGKEFKDHLLFDTVLPWVFDTAMDVLRSVVLKQPFEPRSRGRSYYDRYRDSNTAYDAIYGGRRYGRSSDTRTSRSYDRGGYRREDQRVDYRYIVLKDRRDAEDIVDELHRRIYDNHEVSVAEFLDMLGVSGEPVDNNWGWKDQRDIGIRKSGGGFLIDVREAVYLG